MRQRFSNKLLEIAKKNKKFILLTGDHGYGIFDKFQHFYKSQFLNAGVAEQNMVGVAAGLSRTGFLPMVYGLSSFIPVRVYEQIKIDVAQDKLKVIFIGDGAGLVYSYLGTSHQSFEDIACLRSIPNINIYSPADEFEIDYCFDSAIANKGPSYIRIGKSDLPKVHTKKLKSNNKNSIFKLNESKNSKISILATGSMVYKAIEISKILKCNVYSVPFLKPINKKEVINIMTKSNFLITIEEHSVFGGLGSIISEIISQHSISKLLSIGIEDKFSEKCGSYEYTINEFKLDNKSIIKKINNFLKV